MEDSKNTDFEIVDKNSEKNVNKNEKIVTILPTNNKLEYFPGEEIKGKIQISVKETPLSAIKLIINLKLEHYIKKATNKDPRFYQLKTLNSMELDIPSTFGLKNGKITLQNKELTFDFSLNIPKDTYPTFEFPGRDVEAYIRYFIEAILITEEEKENYGRDKLIFIKNKTRNVDLKLADYRHKTNVEKMGLLNAGKCEIFLKTFIVNYKPPEPVNIVMTIDNSECALAVEKYQLL